MPSIKEITTMCKAGQVLEAYDLAKADMENQIPWAQREMGWVLYYLIKNDTDAANYQLLLVHLDELKTLDQLSIHDDNIFFESVLFKIAGFVKTHVPPIDIGSPTKLSRIFSKLRDYNFESSKGYSYLLQSFIKCDSWQEMADFIDWWDLSKLTSDDYMPYRLDSRKSIISVAERAFISQSKALLRINDFGRIENFLPKMDDLMEKHPEMTYLGYFYGKMLLSLGRTKEEALRVILPFVRKKVTEFWVWQLLSDVFGGEQDKQLACLLRAVNCGAQESYIGKVRIKLATLYIQRSLLEHAKFHIDKVTQCYLSQGWHLPYEVDCWIHQPWINSVIPNSRAPIDYMSITNDILCAGTEESVAVVTHVIQNSQKVTLVYGRKMRTKQKLRIRVDIGSVLKINYITEIDGKFRVLSTNKMRFPSDLDYAKIVEGRVRKRSDKDFAFIKTIDREYYIAPTLVTRHNLQNNEAIEGLIVYDYNSKKESWDWICVSINKKNN